MEDFENLLNKAVRFLSFRPRSEKEIKDYLIKKSSSAKTPKIQDKTGLESVINSVIQKLKEQKFINDEDFVKWWVEQRTLIRPKASRVIKFELKQKGIAKDLIENAFENPKASDLEKARAIFQKNIKKYSRFGDKRKAYEKMGRFLASKGFDYDIIKQVIDPILSKEYND